jgi:hypothetical protein
LKDGIESGTLLEAIAEAAEEVRIRQEYVQSRLVLLYANDMHL